MEDSDTEVDTMEEVDSDMAVVASDTEAVDSVTEVDTEDSAVDMVDTVDSDTTVKQQKNRRL